MSHASVPGTEHDDHNEQQGIHYSLCQTVNRIQDIIGSIDNHSQLHITRQVLLQTRKRFFYLTGNFYRVGTRLLLNHNHGSLHPVIIGFLSTLHRIHDAGHITQEDIRPLCVPTTISANWRESSNSLPHGGHTSHYRYRSYHRNILVFGSDNRADSFNAQVMLPVC